MPNQSLIHSSRTCFLLLLLFTLASTIPASLSQATIYVSPTGSDNNPGTERQPFRTLTAARDHIRRLRSKNSSKQLPSGGVRVRLLPGVYKYDTTLVLGREDSGDNVDRMIVYEGYKGRVIFEGGIEINGWKRMDNEDLNERVGRGGRGKIWGVHIKDVDKRIEKVLNNKKSGDRVVMVFNGELMRTARWPELGYALIGRVRKGKEKPGEMGDVNAPKGAEFKLRNRGVVRRWRKELRRKRGKGLVVGYVDSDFRRLSLRMFGVNGDYLRLMDGGVRGIENRNDKPKRFYVRNMLAELDHPGEWYYDEDDGMIYMYPMGEMSSDTKVLVGTAPAAFIGTDVSYVKVKNIIFQHKAPGVAGEDSFVLFQGDGTGSVVEGCVFRDSPTPGITMETSTKDSIIRDSDFYNLAMFFRIGGGVLSRTEIVSHRHQALNNHCTMTVRADMYPTIAIKGVGTRFGHNLIHNVPNQAMNFNKGGCDHIIAKNEVFNVGFEEGDGGAFYGGGSLWSYGNVFKHNFIHHLISVPDLFPRAAFYSDDHDGGDTYEENILYKGGGDGIKMNKGGGHTVRRNIILNGLNGIWSTSSDADLDFQRAKEYLDNDPDADEKENYFGRAQKVWGKNGWKQGPWKKKYPELEVIMKTYFDQRSMKPYECRFYDNLFNENKENIKAPSLIPTKESREISKGLFEDPMQLNFKLKPGYPSYAPNIPFEDIGLVVAGSRKWIPDKASYRSAARERFADTDVHDNGPYHSWAVNDLLYYNSGEQIFGGTASNARGPWETER